LPFSLAVASSVQVLAELGEGCWAGQLMRAGLLAAFFWPVALLWVAAILWPAAIWGDSSTFVAGGNFSDGSILALGQAGGGLVGW